MDNSGTCWLDTFVIGETKYEVDRDLMVLFRVSDKVILSAPINNVPIQFERFRTWFQDENFHLVYYEAPIEIVRDRLDVMGYNLRTSKEAFQEWIRGEIRAITQLLESEQYPKLLKSIRQSEIDMLAKLTPESWIENLRFIRDSGLKSVHYGNEGEYKDTPIGYMLSHEWHGFPGYDLHVPLRLAIEAAPTGKSFLYDLTNLVDGEIFDVDEDFVRYGLNIAQMDYSSKAKTVVLTEGKSDARILEQSLQILYPHLQDYFSFLDFEISGIGGGVGNLANMVKAFAGAGIVNNVLALFDNDTAAKATLKALELISLPSNIVIRRLPELDFLKNYPTIGPSGQVDLNVNGIAASIELYLGEDVLRVDGKQLSPVQWTGYDRGVRQYQGEVLDKGEIHKRFENKIKQWSGSDGPEWDGLRAIFEVIFTAFDEKRRDFICKLPEDYYRR